MIIIITNNDSGNHGDGGNINRIYLKIMIIILIIIMIIISPSKLMYCLIL
jgi:hypothetical protein